MKMYPLKSSRLSKTREPREGFCKFPRSVREIERSHEARVHGVGINDADYLVNPTHGGRTIQCRAYRTWSNMLARCYSPVFHATHPSYYDCSVDPQWFRFSNFAEWFSQQKTTNRVLDKDLIVPGNRIYSPVTCIMLPSRVNALFTSSKGRGALPRGVDVARGKRKKKFRAQLDINGKRVTLGYFQKSEDAEICYADSKASLIRSLYQELRDEDSRLIPALERAAKALTENR